LDKATAGSCLALSQFGDGSSRYTERPKKVYPAIPPQPTAATLATALDIVAGPEKKEKSKGKASAVLPSGVQGSVEASPASLPLASLKPPSKRPLAPTTLSERHAMQQAILSSEIESDDATRTILEQIAGSSSDMPHLAPRPTGPRPHYARLSLVAPTPLPEIDQSIFVTQLSPRHPQGVTTLRSRVEASTSAVPVVPATETESYQVSSSANTPSEPQLFDSQSDFAANGKEDWVDRFLNEMWTDFRCLQSPTTESQKRKFARNSVLRDKNHCMLALL